MWKDDLLFGKDGRHHPPMPKLLTARGFQNSHGRLAYTSFQRSNAYNMSEYAYKTLGMMPKHYVIVNDRTVDYDPDTALRVGHHRVAIPVKEFARARHLSCMEQWELMHPQWIGTYFTDIDKYRYKRMMFGDALTDAMLHDREAEFYADFWNPHDGSHARAINRVRRWHETLRTDVNFLTVEIDRLTASIKHTQHELETPVSNDIDRLAMRQHLQQLRHQYGTISTKLLEKQKQLDRTERFLQNYDY